MITHSHTPKIPIKTVIPTDNTYNTTLYGTYKNKISYIYIYYIVAGVAVVFSS